MRAVVLSGGGSKGSYQIGVWKALRKLKIKYVLKRLTPQLYQVTFQL